MSVWRPTALSVSERISNAWNGATQSGRDHVYDELLARQSAASKTESMPALAPALRRL